jgi:hypothetical protein
VGRFNTELPVPNVHVNSTYRKRAFPAGRSLEGRSTRRVDGFPHGASIHISLDKRLIFIYFCLIATWHTRELWWETSRAENPSG